MSDRTKEDLLDIKAWWFGDFVGLPMLS